jgi:hypothetical protein
MNRDAQNIEYVYVVFDHYTKTYEATYRDDGDIKFKCYTMGEAIDRARKLNNHYGIRGGRITPEQNLF